MEKRFCALDEPAKQFLIGAAAIGNTRLSSELDALLALGVAYLQRHAAARGADPVRTLVVAEIAARDASNIRSRQSRGVSGSKDVGVI